MNAHATRSFSTAGYNVATLDFDVYSAMTDASNNWLNVAFSTSPTGPWSYGGGSFVQGNTGGWQHLVGGLEPG